MVNSYFGFSSSPFTKDVAVKDIYKWREFEELTNRLSYFLNERGIFLLTGSIGCGKTTALKCFTHFLNPNKYRIIYLLDSFSNRRDFYRVILNSLDMRPPFSTGDARSILRKHLLELYFVKQITPTIIFDEAQNLAGFILEEIRLLYNYDYQGVSPLLVILSGHSLLKKRLSMYENEALNQRITLRFHFNAMNFEETKAYINHCLSKANSSAAIFSDSALEKIFEASSGVARKVNSICSSLLLSAVASEKKIVDELLFNKTSGEWA